MSRNLIPGCKDSKNKVETYYKQVCIYAFSRSHLFEYADFGGKSKIEKFEDIEILRFLDIGHTVRMVKTTGGSLAVDQPEDIEKVEIELMKKINRARLQ